MILIPVVLTIIVGMVFGGSGDVRIEGIKVLFVNEDEGLAGGFIKQGLEAPQSGKLIELKEVEFEDGRNLIDRGKASALIVVPPGFTDSLLDGSSVEITIVKNPSELFLPMIVEEILKTEIVMLEGALDIFDEPIARFRSFLDEKTWPDAEKIAGLVNLSRDRIRLITPYFRDSLIAIDSHERKSDDSEFETNIFSYTFAGSLVIGLFFISMIALGDILREKNSGTMKRVLTAPTSVMQFIMGKALYDVLLTGASYIILLIFAGFMFNSTVRSPIALVALSIGVATVFPGMLTFVFGIVRNERVVSSIIPTLIVGLSMLGGAMIPYEQMGSSLKRIAPFSPVYWVVDGLKKVLVFGGGFSDIAMNLTVIYLVAFISFFAGIFLIYLQLRKGVQ